MAEEDEIDILGDFNLDNFLSKNDNDIYESTPLISQNSDLLNCDYTIHPQWLLDRPSTNPECWYDSTPVLDTGLADRPQMYSSIDNDNLGHVSTENSITDESGWTEKEKNLLERGIEIFGKSNVNLSQFIGSRTPAEVKYYLKNFYTEAATVFNSINPTIVEDASENNYVSDILVDTQIPASIEEVIAAVSTAKPTIQQINKRSHKKSTSSSMSNSDEDDRKSTSSRKSNTKIGKISSSTRDTSSLGRNKFSKNNKIIMTEQKNKHKTSKVAKFKFKTKVKMPLKNLNNDNIVNQKVVKLMNQDIQRAELTKVEITTGKGLAVPICEGEEIVKICPNDSDSDVEIDVEDDIDDVKIEKPQQENINIFTTKQQQQQQEEKIDEKEMSKVETLNNKQQNQQKSFIDLTNLDNHLYEKLTNLDKPTHEVELNENFISDLEKAVHSEFFEGRPTKTPLRYLKIRNHIINCWKTSKGSYVTKTSIRQGLKNCGDVNCISRIHCYLEQIGVINFGCAQTNYVRPLLEVFQAMAPSTREKNSNKEIKIPPKNNLDFASRQRNRRKFLNDGEGGRTLTHNERGEVINTTIVNEEPTKARIYIKKPSIRLIYSRPFSNGTQKFSVKINLTTLLLMDLHAHSSLTEVMGLVGGIWDSNEKNLTITLYTPCRNIASSSTHCDMCPISQSLAADKIHNKDLDILGWFHSHPTFAPEPSQQDLDTQQNVQCWIGNKIPCLGIILSPFSANGALIASPFRCIIVDKKENFEDQFVPYKFHVDLITDNIDLNSFLNDIKNILKFDVGLKESRIDFSKPYFQDASITYLEKYITSVRMHLAKCGTLNKMTCDSIIEGITRICSELNS